MISRIQIPECRGVWGLRENHSPLVSSFLSSVFDDPPAEVAALSSAAAAVAVDDGGLLLPAAEPLLPDPPIMFFVGDTTTTTMCCRVYISTMAVREKSTRNFLTNTRAPAAVERQIGRADMTTTIVRAPSKIYVQLFLEDGVQF